MKTEAPHFSYPKREGYFADTKRLGHVNTNITTEQHHRMWAEGVAAAAQDQLVRHGSPDAPYMDAPFDWAETQGDLAPVVRKINTALLCGVLVMAGWVAGCLMVLAAMKGGL